MRRAGAAARCRRRWRRFLAGGFGVVAVGWTTCTGTVPAVGAVPGAVSLGSVNQWRTTPPSPAAQMSSAPRTETASIGALDTLLSTIQSLFSVPGLVARQTTPWPPIAPPIAATARLPGFAIDTSWKLLVLS